MPYFLFVFSRKRELSHFFFVPLQKISCAQKKLTFYAFACNSCRNKNSNIKNGKKSIIC